MLFILKNKKCNGAHRTYNQPFGHSLEFYSEHRAVSWKDGDCHFFNALLQKNEKYPVDKSVSSVCWGNKEASDTITVITNPHCDPCAALHRNLERFLERGGDRFCIQYVFTSFNEELSVSAKFLIWAYIRNDEAAFCSFLTDGTKKVNIERNPSFKSMALNRIGKWKKNMPGIMILP